MSKHSKIRAGSLFTVSSGEYSDYFIRGVFRALRDIDPEALLREWLKDHPDQAERYSFKDIDFLAWAFRLGAFETVPAFDWHLGSYSSADFSVTDVDNEMSP